MRQLTERWHALGGGEFSEGHAEFRLALRFAVCRNYPWLVSELFALEGLLGWGPGFRDYDGEFFPPMLPEAPARMGRFLELLSLVQPDDVMQSIFTDAITGRPSGRLAGMISVSLRAKLCFRPSIISLLYDKIAVFHSSYVLGGARIFFSLWTQRHNYALAVTGLAWLLHRPISPVYARAETVRRKLLKARPVATSSSANQMSQVMPPVVIQNSPAPVPALLYQEAY
jgi:hypothetical protein